MWDFPIPDIKGLLFDRWHTSQSWTWKVSEHPGYAVYPCDIGICDERVARDDEHTHLEDERLVHLQITHEKKGKWSETSTSRELCAKC